MLNDSALKKNCSNIPVLDDDDDDDDDDDYEELFLENG